MSDEPRYSYFLRFSGEGGEWCVVDLSTKGPANDWDGDILFRHPYSEAEEDGSGEPPAPVREVYEKLIGYVPGALQEPPLNLVELVSDEESAFDQPCIYGHRVDGHAVYCHNDTWLYAPRKCRRTWYTGGEIRDEDCKGYKPNPRFPSLPSA